MLLPTTSAHRWRVAAMATLLVAASWLVIIDSRSPAATNRSVARDAWRGVSAQTLPKGLQAPRVEANQRVVSIVAADIDADGDLDVVATDTSLELLVWTNDGSGRLTRQQPRRSSGLQNAPESPSVAQQKAATVVSIQNDTLSIGADSGERASVPETTPLVARSRFHIVGASLLGARSPRGPPSPVS